MALNIKAIGQPSAAMTAVLLANLVLACPPAVAKTLCPSHFASGTEPAVTNPKLMRSVRPLCFSTFAVLHSGLARTPLYSAEHLTRASVEAAQALDARDNRFHAERRLPKDERAELDDYSRSGFDRGHMAPSGDMESTSADHESFSLANIVPQAAQLNRSSWASLEGYVRQLTLALGDAYVVTGPLYEGTNVKRVGGRVLVPTSVWKAMYVPGRGAGAWIATNAAKPDWQVVSIATLTARSGINPFPTLDSASAAKVPAFPTFGSHAVSPRRRRR